VRIFKNKWFTKFARKEGITDAMLCAAIHRAEQGVWDASYGGGVIKQRIARQNEGKSGGYRSIILFRSADKAFFVYGFAKNDQANISTSDESDFKELAKYYLNASHEQLEWWLKNKKWIEVENDQNL
jgi:hypothetical protein